MIEEWRTAPGHPDYEVSSHGRVRRAKAHLPHLAWRVGLILKGNNIKGRYVQVELNGKGLLVHRLVAMAFIGPAPSPEAVVMHIDEDAELFNAVWNLKWGTSKENIDDWVAKKRTLAGEKNANAKLTEKQALEIKASKLTNRALAAQYRISCTLVWMIKRGKAWKHLPTPA